MTWHKDYTKEEIENLLTNMCNWIGEQLEFTLIWDCTKMKYVHGMIG